MTRKRKLRRYDTPFGRCYLLGHPPLEKIMPSVTTVLGQKKLQYVEDLREKLGEEKLTEISNNAALRGTAMHKYLENYLIAFKAHNDDDKALLYTQKKTLTDLDGTMPTERIDKGRELFYNIYNEGLLNKIKKILFTERFIWSIEHLFAGTADHGFVTFDDKIVLGDFKSASSPRGEEQIQKNRMQLGAYAIAFEENFGYRVSGAEIWISHPQGVQVIELDFNKLQKAKNEFLELLNEFHSQWDSIKIAEYIKESGLKDSESQNV